MLDFAGLFTHSRDIGFITDLRGAILASTLGAERALGYSREELTGLDLPHLDEGGDLRRFLERDGDPQSRMQVGFHLRTKSGKVLAIGSLASSLRDEAGKPVGWMFACQDLRGAVAESRGSRPILDALVDSIGAALWSFDRNGTVITWSRACEEYFGVPRAEAEGKLPAVRLFSSPEEFRRVLRAVDEKGLYSGEMALVTRGSTRFNQLSVTPLAPDRQSVGYTAVSFDLSERLKAEEFYRVLFHKANDAVFLVEGESLRMVEVNEATCRLLGYTRDEFLALRVPDIVPPDKRHLIQGVRQSVEAPAAFRRDRRNLLRKDGSTVLTDHTIGRLDIGGKAYFLAAARDLTDTVRAEQELQEAKAFLEHVQQGASDGIAILDQDGFYVSVNPRHLELHGMTADRFIGHNFREHSPPELLAQNEEYYRRLLAGEKIRMKATIRHPSGRGIPVDVSSAAFERGGRKFVVALVRDATEQARDEEARNRAQDDLERRVDQRTAQLRESEERFRGAFAHGGIGMSLVGTDGRFLHVNRALCEMLGLTEPELLATTFNDITHPDDRERSADLARRLLDGKISSGRLEKRYLHKQGRAVWTDLVTTMVRDGQGRPLYFVTVIQDITERKRAEEALRESEQQFRQIAEHIRHVFYVADPDQKGMQYISPAYEEVWGRSCESLYARPLSWMESVHPDDRSRVSEIFDWSKPRSGPREGEYRVIRPDGTVRWVLDRCFEIADPSGKVIRLVGFAEDITGRKKADEELRSAHEDLERRVDERTALLSAEIADRRRAEERLRLYKQVFANANEGVAIIDPAGVYLEQNGAHRRMTGYTDEDLRGQTPAIHLGAEAFARIAAQLTDKGVYHGEHLSRTKDGREISIDLSAFTMKDAAGNVLCHVGIKRDITERKRAGEALRDSEERWRSVVTHAPDFILTADPQGNILSINRTVPGLTPEQVVGRSIFDYTPADHHAVLRGAMDHVLTTGEPTAYELPAPGPNGTIAWYASRAGPIRRGREVVGITFIATDVTERRRAEETLRFQKTLLESQSEAAIDGILVVSTDGRMVSFNRRFVEMWDLSSEVVQSRSDEAALKSVLEKVMDPQAFLSRVRYLYDHSDEESRDEIVLKDGRTFDRYSAPVRSQDGVRYGRVWYFRDVTGRKRTEQELRRAAEETRRAYDDLKQAQEQLLRSEKLASIGMLVSGVAHEINNPLNVMYGNLQLLAEQCAGMSGRVPASLKAGVRKFKSMIRDALRAAHHARNIVEEFRSFARDTRTAEAVDLNVCLEEMASLAQREIGARVRFVKRLRPVPPVRCFRGQMNQVFLNLLKNAGEAIERRGTVTLRTRRKDGHVVIEIADTGRGMAEDVRKKLFEPFFTTKPVGKGLGLGLSISAMIVHNHGGRISVRSRVGRGSVFRVELPIRE